MIILIETIAHQEQAYRTVGNWRFFGDTLIVQVSDTGNELSNQAIAFHEIHEALACRRAGITEQQVDAWDARFEQEREDGKHGPHDEPGHAPGCVYGEAHRFAELVESTVISAGGDDWFAHCKRVEALDPV